jgi:orotidine-5'-phosphate decarboxylase
MTEKNIIVALDDPFDYKEVLSALNPQKCIIKVGSIIFNYHGRKLLDEVANHGFEIFFDIKFHDIPNTVSKSIESFKGYPIKLLTIHLSGGRSMIKAALDSSRSINARCIGVSILTSLNEEECKEVYTNEISKTVSSMFNLANETNIDGVVCSPHELKLAEDCLQDKIKITPGIRLSGSDSDDQSRVMSPKKAIDLGATYLVIGRPITSHKDVASAFEKIYQSINEE